MKKLPLLLFEALFCWKVLANNIELNPSHRGRRVVAKGDTLLDVSAKFLQTPGRWPDIWQTCEQIANPPLIYIKISKKAPTLMGMNCPLQVLQNHISIVHIIPYKLNEFNIK